MANLINKNLFTIVNVSIVTVIILLYSILINCLLYGAAPKAVSNVSVVMNGHPCIKEPEVVVPDTPTLNIVLAPTNIRKKSVVTMGTDFVVNLSTNIKTCLLTTFAIVDTLVNKCIEN
jgi:hypothetical protein